MKNIFNMKAHSMTLVLALSLLFSGAALAQQVDPAAWYGDGSASEYFIGTGAELAYLANILNSRIDNFDGKTITLTSDIDLAMEVIEDELRKYPVPVMDANTFVWGTIPYDGGGWIPIGSVGLYANWFYGTFDGNGYVIKNLYINRPDGVRQGLFGYTRLTSTIKNLGVIDVDVTGTTWVGGIVGNANGSIENSFTTGKVVGIDGGRDADVSVTGANSGSYVGGIAGQMTNTIRNSYSTADVTGGNTVGGIGGVFSDAFSDRTSISEYLYSTGTITAIRHPLRAGSEYSGGLFSFVMYANNTLQNSVALNESLVVTKEVDDINGPIALYNKRVAFEHETNAATIELINNFALEGMTLKNLNTGAALVFPDGTRDSDNGESVSADQIYDGTVWGADYANFPTDIWLIRPGELPILKIFETRSAARGGVSVQSATVPNYILEKVDPAILSGLGVLYNDSAVVVKKAERLAVATLWFTVDSGKPQFTGLNNFSVLDTAVDGNRYRVTLGYLVAGGAGFTSANAGIATISGATGVNLVNARFSGYDANGNAGDISYHVEKDGSGGVIIPGDDDDPGVVDPIVNYDLNGDGVVDQLDLTIALSYFTARSGDANWNNAKIADFNNDSVVDIEDFIRLLNNIAW